MLRALAIAFLIGLASVVVGWLFYWNDHEATLHLADNYSITFPMALHVLAALALGGAIVLGLFLMRSALFALARTGRRRRARRLAAADALLSEGSHQLWSGDVAGAHKSLGRALRRRPDDLESALALARAHEEREEWQAALDVLEQTRASHQGSDPRLLSRIGRVALASGNAGAAIGAFREAVQVQPDSPRLLAELATALAAEGHLAEAADAAGRRVAQEKEPDRKAAARHEWLTLRYRAALNEADARVAQDLLQKLTREEPTFLPPILELARLRREGGDVKGADKLYRDALRREVRGVVLERLAALHASVGRAEKALTPLRQAARSSQLAAARLTLARQLIAADKLEDAAAELESIARATATEGSADTAPERDLVAGELAVATDSEREAVSLFRRAAVGSHLPFSYACRNCGRTAEAWSDQCACGVWGEFEWRIGAVQLAPPK